MPSQLVSRTEARQDTVVASDGANGYRALVFNSELLHGKVTCRGLTASGFDCDFSYKPADAIAKLEAGRYDLILIDLRKSGAEQVRVAAAAFANRHDAKIMAIIAPGSREIVRTLLAYGVDDIATDSDTDLLGIKALSLIEIDAWRKQTLAEHESHDVDEEPDSLEKIEKSLLRQSAGVREKLGDPFAPAEMSSSLRESITLCVERARRMRTGPSEGGRDRRMNERESVCLTATAIPLGADGMPCSDPFAVVVGDLSMTGARLADTRPIAAKRIVLHWRCATIPDEAIAVQATVVRCETVGRFYEIGVRFE